MAINTHSTSAQHGCFSNQSSRQPGTPLLPTHAPLFGGVCGSVRSQHLTYSPEHEGIKVTQALMACQIVERFAREAAARHGLHEPGGVPGDSGGSSGMDHGAGNSGTAAGGSGGGGGGRGGGDGGSRGSGAGVPIVMGGDFNSAPGYVFDAFKRPAEVSGCVSTWSNQGDIMVKPQSNL